MFVDRSSSSSDALLGLPEIGESSIRARNFRGRRWGPLDAVVIGTTRTYSSVVTQALTQQMQPGVQQAQSPIKFDVPVFEGDSVASCLTWSQRVVHQARACGFEPELTAAEREELSVGAGVFYGSNVDPVRLRNAHEAWLALINSCR